MTVTRASDSVTVVTPVPQLTRDFPGTGVTTVTQSWLVTVTVIMIIMIIMIPASHEPESQPEATPRPPRPPDTTESP